VATRPKVHQAELLRAVARITDRRVKVDDRHREKLSDDPREVLDYLQRYSGPDIPRWVRQSDVCDSLTLLNWLWWEDRRRELRVLKTGRDLGLFLSQLGAQVGVGKQGVLDRIDRLEALLRYDRPDEQLIRSARQAQREKRDRRSGEVVWLDAQRETVLAVIAGLVGQADRYVKEGDDRDWLDELAIDGREENLTPETMTILGLATGELRTARAVLELDSTRPHAVHTLLARADALRSQFAELGTKGGRPQRGAA
jgi:hypothetical protein